MTFDDIVDLAEKAGCDVSAIDGREYQTMWCDSEQLERFAAALIQAGAASRDAEIARLKAIPVRYRRMAFNAQLQDEIAELVAALETVIANAPEPYCAITRAVDAQCRAALAKVRKP